LGTKVPASRVRHFSSDAATVPSPDTTTGSFKNPPPGQPTSKPYDDKSLALGSKVDGLDDPVARKNFRLVVIVPDSVEQTDLSNPEKARRYRYTFDESNKANAGWRTEELWP
jgi:pyridoxamine 5'-phosphate oxidase